MIESTYLIQVQLFLLRVAKEGRGKAERDVNKKRAEIARVARKMGGRGDTSSILFPLPPFICLGVEMTAQALNARLTPLFDSLKQTQQLINRLSKFPAHPGASPSSSDEGDALVELSAEIHQTLKEQEEEFELLRQEVEDQTNTSGWLSSTRRRDSAKDSQRTDLAAQITRLGEDLKL